METPHRVDDETLAEIAETCRIRRDQIEEVYGCTELQTRALAESAIHNGASIYRFVLSLSPNVDLDRWCAALKQVVRLNAVLRSRLVDSRLGLIQVVVDGDFSARKLDGSIEQYLVSDREKPLGLGDSLYRSEIVGRTWVNSFHHAVMDHSSLTMLFRDVIKIYHGREPLAHAPFKDFVTHCQKIDEEDAKTFWGSRFRGSPVIFPKVEPGFSANATSKTARRFTSSVVGPEVPLARLPAAIETAFAMTLASYSGSDSVAYGMVLSGRTPSLEGLETTMGPTIATVPVQANLRRTMSIEELVKDRTTSLRQLQTHPAVQYPISSIRQVNEAAKAASGFQALLNIRPSLHKADEESDLKYEYMIDPDGSFSFCVYVDIERDGALAIQAMSDPRVICSRQLERVADQLIHMLHVVFETEPQIKIGKLSLLSPQDRRELEHWNAKIPDAVGTCIHDMFRDRARQQPDLIAVDAWNGRMTYSELDQATDRLALHLRHKGAGPGTYVPFIFEKSLWAVVAILGTLKAGAACVPIDASHPQDRKASIISSVKAKFVLTSEAELDRSGSIAAEAVVVTESAIYGLKDADQLETSFSSHDLAYTIFSSGTSGTPKGVMLEHRCLASSLTSLGQRFGWNKDCRILQFASHIWDISIGETLGAFLFGACLCIPSEMDRSSNLDGFIRSANVNWAWMTPSLLRTLSPDIVPGLKALLCIGEPIGPGPIQKWGSKLRLCNGWGPCETSILSSVADYLTPSSPFPESIGRPIGCALWIVNPASPDDLLAIGATGELIVQGPGVARGYLNDDTKEARAFIHPPSWSLNRKVPGRMYRTGDLARFNPDGSLCFIGRQDNQVKIRGQRFELGEVENVIGSCEPIADVFTSIRILDGRTELVAVVSLSVSSLPRETMLGDYPEWHAVQLAEDISAVRQKTVSKLPSFMCPTIWIAVQEMPHTSSFKLDRQAIAAWLKTKDLRKAKQFLHMQTGSNLTTPNTERENMLQEVWASVLNIEKTSIGRESSFIELGGDSILAMQVSNRCHKLGVQVKTVSVLKELTLAHLAAESMTDAVPEDFSDGSNLANNEHKANHLQDLALQSPLSRLSRANHFFDAVNIVAAGRATDAQAFMLSAGGYQIRLEMEISPGINCRRLLEACEAVIRHHDILRTLFFQHGPALYQVVLESLPQQASIERETVGIPAEKFTEETTLAHFRIIDHDGGCNCLYLDIHHALYDALSLDLILRDLNAALGGHSMSSGLQFLPWLASVEAMDHRPSKQYWSELLRGSRMPIIGKEIVSRADITLNHRKRVLVPLDKLSTSYSTPSNVLKAAWSVVLSAAIDLDDVVFGEVSTNRFIADGLDQVRGPCLNFVPVRAGLKGNVSLDELVRDMHAQASESLPHHHVGFRSIIRDCTSWANISRFSLVVVYQNHRALDGPKSLGDSTCTMTGSGEVGDSADVFAIATPKADQLEVELNYSDEILSHNQVLWMSEALTHILNDAPSHPSKYVSALREELSHNLGRYPKDPEVNVPISNGYTITIDRPAASIGSADLVSKAWEDMQLYSESSTEDPTIFDCGGDSVTAMLLSKHYVSHGFKVSTADVLRSPRRSAQAHLIETLR